MKIDIYNHILPRPYFDKTVEVAPRMKDMGKRVGSIPMLVDLDERFRVMDTFGDYCQILAICTPFPEQIGSPEVSPVLARIANDSMAELVQRYPDRFPAFVAALPINNMDATVAEIHRAVKTLGARGVQIKTNINGHPLDEPCFEPLFATMAEYNLPLWVHPARAVSMTDYASESHSRYEIWWTFGYPYETSAFMARMVFSGMFDKYPNLKLITHHLGAMIPFFEGRVGPGCDQLGSRTSDEDYGQVLRSLKQRPLEYFKMFYADTATFGSRSAMRCGLDFFGAEHVLFGTDAPFDPEKGPGFIRETIRALNELDVSAEVRERIYWRNAAQLLNLKLQ